MRTKCLIVWMCGLLMVAGCGPVSELEDTAVAEVTSPRDPDGFARQLVGTFAARNTGGFMRLVISEAAMTDIIQATTVDAATKERLITETPMRIGPRRATLAKSFESRLEAGHLEGTRWEDAIFTGVEVLSKRADSGTMTRSLRIRLDISGVAYTVTAKECISRVDGPIYLLSDLQGPISETALRVEAMRATVRAVHGVASAYYVAKGEYPMDVPALAAAGFGEVTVEDSWGTELSMWARGEAVQICSAGPDTTHGSYDDVCWPK